MKEQFIHARKRAGNGRRYAARCAALALAAVLMTAGVPVTSRAAFPGGNGKIVFVSNRTGNDEVFVMNADGSGQTNLTNNPSFDFAPTWSPDGMRIAFVSGRAGNAEIYVMNADGSSPTRLTNNPAFDTDPAWSADGTKIAFASNRDGNNEIYVMNADGSGVERLTFNPGTDTDAAFSFDGTRVAFRRSAPNGDAEIYVMAPDGSGQTRLTVAPGLDNDPDWSPDGTKIVFRSARDGNTEIYVMGADGGGQLNLTNRSTGDFQPAWSPDGTKIAFMSNRDGNSEIYVMNVDGSSPTRLTMNSTGDEDPDWQPLIKQVAVDVKPGDCPSPLNIDSRGVLPIAIAGAAGFDVADLDPASVRLEGVAALRSALEDVTGPSPSRADCDLPCDDAGADTILDMTLKFDTQAVVAALGEVADGQCVVLRLKGWLRDGTLIVGEDVVKIIKKP